MRDFHRVTNTAGYRGWNTISGTTYIQEYTMVERGQKVANWLHVAWPRVDRERTIVNWRGILDKGYRRDVEKRSEKRGTGEPRRKEGRKEGRVSWQVTTWTARSQNGCKLSDSPTYIREVSPNFQPMLVGPYLATRLPCLVAQNRITRLTPSLLIFPLDLPSFVSFTLSS